MNTNKNIRLYIESKLTPFVSCEISTDRSHYLCNVMRCKEGDFINCFNENDGEFLTKILKINKKNTVIEPQKQLKAQEKTSDLWVLFAPLKKDNTDYDLLVNGGKGGRILFNGNKYSNLYITAE